MDKDRDRYDGMEDRINWIDVGAIITIVLAVAALGWMLL